MTTQGKKFKLNVASQADYVIKCSLEINNTMDDFRSSSQPLTAV